MFKYMYINFMHKHELFNNIKKIQRTKTSYTCICTYFIRVTEYNKIHISILMIEYNKILLISMYENNKVLY